MRKTETIELGDKDQKIEVTIRELTVEQVLGIFDKWQNAKTIEESDDEIGTFKEEIGEVFKLTVSGVTFDELNKYAPSELREMWETFKGVNGVFFEVIDSIGIMESLNELIKATKDDFLKIFRGSSNEDTGTS